MKDSPLISVIVPVYKVEAYLDRCLTGLRRQTLSAIEIILVDDGSPDRCPAMCDEAAREDSRIRVIHQENRGLSAARNAGIQAAVSPYLMFADSDDEAVPSFCECALERIRTAGADIGVFDFWIHEKDGTPRITRQRSFPAGVYQKEEALEALAKGSLYDFAWNKIYRRELFEGIRYPEGELWEDIGTTFRLFAGAETVCVSHDLLYHYYMREGNISSAYPFRQVTEEILKQREKEYFYFLEQYPRAAEAMEKQMTGIELDYCMYRCLDRKDEKYKEVRRRLLERRIGRKELGWKMWIKKKCLRIPLLFCLITADRRRRMAQ